MLCIPTLEHLYKVMSCTVMRKIVLGRQSMGIIVHLDGFAAQSAFGPPVWGPNVKEFKRRFDLETSEGQGPQRLKNLYFTYLVELRALAKATPYLLQVKQLNAVVVSLFVFNVKNAMRSPSKTSSFLCVTGHVQEIRKD